MFVKIEDYWLNTEQIVNLEPQGKAFRVNLSNGAFLVLNLKDYLVLIKAMKIKSPLKAVKKKLFEKLVQPKVITSSPAVSDNAKLNRTTAEKAKVEKLKKEKGKGASGGDLKTKLIKKVAAEKLSFGDIDEKRGS